MTVRAHSPRKIILFELKLGTIGFDGSVALIGTYTVISSSSAAGLQRYGKRKGIAAFVTGGNGSCLIDAETKGSKPMIVGVPISGCGKRHDTSGSNEHRRQGRS
jgi:hypothetical protein